MTAWIQLVSVIHNLVMKGWPAPLSGPTELKTVKTV